MIILSSLALDIIYPYHSGILYRIHVVHTSYMMALKLFKKAPRTKLHGLLIWLFTVVSHIGLYTLILYASSLVHRILWLIASIYVLKNSISLKLLLNHVRGVEECLKENNLECAKRNVSGIVRRRVDDLGSGHVASAALESLYESLVDGFTSPLLYYVFLGPLGSLLQRIINTLDSALGYKEPEYREVGWFSAKADTIINYVPARLTAFIEILTCPLIKGSLLEAFKIYNRDKDATESMNAGHPMAAASGCLRVKLEKISSYTIGREYDLPKWKDLHSGIIHVILITIIYLLIVFILIIAIQHLLLVVIK